MKSTFKNHAITWCLSVIGAAGLFAVPFMVGQLIAEASVDGRSEFDPTDQDGDGMSDAWEIHHFGSVEARDGMEDDDLDDILNVDEWNAGTDPLHLDPQAVGESGFVEVAQPDAGHWHTVRLDGAYSNPVVIMGPASSRGKDPLTLRVDNVTANSFDFQFDEYEYLDGLHGYERLSWIVVEEGAHVLPGGQTLRAGYSDVEAGGTAVVFAEPFAHAPVVLSQVASYHGTYATTPHQWNVSATGFEVILRNHESWVVHGKTESLAWIAIEKGQGTGVAGAYEVGATGRSVDHSWRSVSFTAPLPAEPTFHAMMQSQNEGDTVTIRYQNLTATGTEIRLVEEQSGDGETAHTTEDVGYLAASPGMFHVLPTTGDTDADGVADAYELANGLVIGEFDFYRDLDGDGLTNAEEYRHGTRADLADTDGDLVSDFEEIHFLKSDALASDVGAFQLAQTIAGANLTNSFGEWTTADGKAQQVSVRGSAEYSITALEAGVYSVEIDLAPYSGASRSSHYEIVVSIDGEFISREALVMDEGQTGTARVLTPWLDAGSHSLSVFINNSYTFRRAEIREIRVLSATGADSNGNGVVDWVEIRTENQNGLVRSYALSKTSPVCLEGNGRFTSLIQSNLPLSVQQGPNRTWFADLDLDPGAQTELELSFENGAVVETESIQWVPTNLLEESSLTIRQGDALRLTATTLAHGSPLENVSLSVEGNLFTTTADQPLIHRFNQPGSQLIDVVHTDESGVQTTHQIAVRVVPRVADLNSPVCVVGFERPWSVSGLPAEALVQIDDDVAVFDGQRIGTDGYSYTIATRSPESQHAIVRLGYSGPVLGSTEIRSMTLRSADKTSVFYAEDLGDGTHLLNMPVVLSEAHAGIEITCEIYLAGVMYPDGSQITTLQPQDFDVFGSHTLEFIKPQNAHSNCHRFRVWQNGIRIAFFN